LTCEEEGRGKWVSTVNGAAFPEKRTSSITPVKIISPAGALSANANSAAPNAAAIRRAFIMQDVSTLSGIDGARLKRSVNPLFVAGH